MKSAMTGVLALLCVFAVAGCVSTRPTYMSNGAKGYAIACRGAFRGWESCLVRAGRICRDQGYNVFYSDEFDRRLIVACGKPAS